MKFLSSCRLLKNHGEVTTDLLEPRLTHLIVSKQVPDRYELLIRKTSQYVHAN